MFFKAQVVLFDDQLNIGFLRGQEILHLFPATSYTELKIEGCCPFRRDWETPLIYLTLFQTPD